MSSIGNKEQQLRLEVNLLASQRESTKQEEENQKNAQYNNMLSKVKQLLKVDTDREIDRINQQLRDSVTKLKREQEKNQQNMMKLKEDYQRQKEADREQMSKELEDFKASYVSSQDQDSTKRMYLLHDYTDDSQAANGSIIEDTLTNELDQSINSSQKKRKRQGQKKRKQYLDN